MKFTALRYCLYFLSLSALGSFYSCKKDSFTTSPGAILGTSDEIIRFDTVFTSIGSVTQSFTIRNENDQKLLLNRIKLMGGDASAYKININGLAASEAADIVLAAEDSMYVFVTVNINPNLDNLPFIVKDSIQIQYNGNTRYVQLEAFGQNANFLRNRVINNNTTWNSRLPYVILDRLQIDTNITLTLEPGCKIYCHANAPILVDGTLVANGTKNQPIIFTGDRTDEHYRDLPAGWPGIYFRETSKSNELSFTTVKNAYQALVAESAASNSSPKLVLHQCIIDNAYDAGILAVNSSVFADNCLISNCGSNINLLLGGAYSFTNCTAAAYSPYIVHKNPVLSASNFAVINGSAITSSLDAVFTNCIFWGEPGFVENEIIVNKQGTDPVTVNFTNCLYRAVSDPANATITDCIKNQNPLFDSIDVNKRIFDYHLTLNPSPALDAGVSTIFTKDLDSNSRTVPFDIGCYEKQ